MCTELKKKLFGRSVRHSSDLNVDELGHVAGKEGLDEPYRSIYSSQVNTIKARSN